MANKSSTVGSVRPLGAAALQRGKACLRCRKRKMRCDGNKPACQQCVRAKKPDGCEYDDGKGKTRTQILRETIERLESRVRELEGPESSQPSRTASVSLFDSHITSYDSPPSSDPSSCGSPDHPSALHSHSPFLSDSAGSPISGGSWTHLPGTSTSPPILGPPDMFFDAMDPSAFDIFELEPILLEIFAPHRYQVGLNLHIGHLRESINKSPEERRHPSLMNAIYLWACFISRPEPLCQHEPHYLQQCRESIADGLQLGAQDKILDVLQASCLLALYYFVNGRMLEGSYHASAAASLGIQCGLHKGVWSEGRTGASAQLDAGSQYLDGIRDGERVMAFWQLYNLDRCWSVVLRKPFAIPDGPDSWSSITCPWPQHMSDYETGHPIAPNPFQTVGTFLLSDGVSSDGYSVQALRAKASALFSAAYQLSLLTQNGADTYQREERDSLERSITRFISTLVPIHQLESTTLADERQRLLVTHSLAHAAIIHLSRNSAHSDAVAYDKCGRAARAIVRVTEHIGEGDLKYLDPIIGTCWEMAVETLSRELTNVQSTWPMFDTADIRNDIGTILYAMNVLSTSYPVLGHTASRLQKMIAEL